MAHKTSQPRLLLPAPSIHSGVKIAVLAAWYKIRRLATPRHLLVVAAGTYLTLSLVFAVSFFVPRALSFSFAESTCMTNPTLLPNLIAKKQSPTFSATAQPTLSIAGYPLYSHTTCVTPTQAPTEHQTQTISFNALGLSFLHKSIRVSTDTLPALRYQTTLAKPLPTKEKLSLPLTTIDNVFDYQLAVKDQTLPCSKTDGAVVCDLAKLHLEQSAAYTFTMQRSFKGKTAHTLFAQRITTVGAVVATGSSITAGQTVFSVPTAMDVTFNKLIKSFDGVHLVVSATGQQLPITTTLKDQTLTVQFTQALPRSASIVLYIDSIAATDGGHLPDTFVLPFVTSGGPKIKGVSIGASKVSPSANIVLSFDSTVSPSQTLRDFVRLEIGGQPIAASLSRSGSTVTINPEANLPACTRFTVKVLDGLQNEFGIAGGSAWQYNSRTLCQVVFGIGSSVQGRSILAYRFGSGASTIVYVGTTHGDEKSSTYILNSWIDYLEAHYDQIPSGRTIVVIPNLNPDGYAVNKRTNAHNVDLNRNFPASNWKQGVTMPGGSYNANGGGSAPLSEPESSAIANYLVATHPRLVLTYHAAAGVVMPNDAGDSDALAKTYDQKSNVNYEPASQTGTIFTYDTTGAMEDWLGEKHNITALLVELWTKTGSEFSKHQNAMLHMAQLP